MRIYKEDTGSALLATFVVVLVFMLFGVTLGLIAVHDFRSYHREQARVEAHYLAYSGTNALLLWLRDTLLMGNEEEVEAILGRESAPNNQFQNGTFTVQVDPKVGEDLAYSIFGIGTVRGITAKVIATVRFEFSSLPENWEDIFPGLDLRETGENRSFVDGRADRDEEVQWVKRHGNNYRVDTGGSSDKPVDFPSSIEVEHQKSQEGAQGAITFSAPYLLFRNTEGVALDIKQGNRLITDTQILVFLGTVELDEHTSTPGTLQFTTYGEPYGKVYFYQDVVNQRGQVVLKKGGYRFTDGCVLDGNHSLANPPTCLRKEWLSLGGSEDQAVIWY